jgi:hypothetical protein
MLDLMKLARQMQGISQHLSQEAAAAQERVTAARRLLAIAATRQANFVEQADIWGDRAPFTAAQPTEPLTDRTPSPPPPRLTLSLPPTARKFLPATTRSPTAI